MTDLELLDKYVRSRDQQAFAELARRHVDWVYSAARRQVHDEHLAQDVTQAVFWLLANKADHVRRTGNTNLGGWLFTVTRFTSLRLLRSESRRKKREQAAASEAPLAEEAADEPTLTVEERVRVTEMLDEVVNRLGRTDRRAVLLRFYQGKSLREVSEELGITEEAARKRVTRAVGKLRQMLEAVEIAVPAAALATWMSAGVSSPAPAAVVSAVTSIAIADVAVGGSVAALAKGAWTMMGWAKAKFVALAVGASLVVAGGGGAVVTMVASARQPSPPPVAAAAPTTAPATAPSDTTTLVSVNADRASAQSVIEGLCKQANIELNIWPDWVWRDSKRTVTLSAKDQPFWIAMVDACQQAQVWPQPTGGGVEGPGITIHQQGRGDNAKTVPYPRLYRDGILIVARGAGRSHSIGYDRPDELSESFNLSFHAFADPKMRVLRVARTIKLTEATDENGLSLLHERQQGDMVPRSWPFRSTMVFDLDAGLKYHRDQGKVLKNLKGEARLLLATKTDEWEVTDLSNAAGQNRAFQGGKYTIDEIKAENPQRVNMRFTITYPTSTLSRFTGGDSPTESPLMDTNTISKLLRLVDAKGNAYNTTGGGGGGGGGKLQYDISFYIPPEKLKEFGPPAKLVWSIPTEMKEVTIPVEFHDLPIP